MMSNKMTNPLCRVLIYGERGALSTSCISHFKSCNCWVACIDVCDEEIQEINGKCSNIHMYKKGANDTSDPYLYNVNGTADVNILVHSKTSLQEQENEVIKALREATDGKKLDVIICITTSLNYGNASNNFVSKVNEMWKQNVWPAIIAASVAVDYLNEGGFLCLPGAQVALEGSPNMVAYGLTKAAVHQLTKSLACQNSGLPKNTLCVALLPVTLDVNKQGSSEEDISTWTPVKYITDLLYKWSVGEDRPKNGSLVQFATQNFITDVSFL